MRRTAIFAAVVTSAASIALIAPAAQAVSAGHRLTGIVSCDQGGRAKLVTSVNAAGTEHAKVTVTGVDTPHWRGGLQVNPAKALASVSDDSDLTDAQLEALLGGPDKSFTAKHGRFSTSGKLVDSRSLDATANFSSGVSMCNVSTVSMGDRYAVLAADGVLALRTDSKPAVQAVINGEAHHRFRFVFTVHTKAGTRHATLFRTAGSMGAAQATLSGVKQLSSFSAASVTITDLTVRTGSESYQLQR